MGQEDNIMGSLNQIERLEQLSSAQWFALATKLGGLKNVIGLLQDDLEAELKEAIKLLFDRHGICIKKPETTAAVCDPNRAYHLDPLPENFDIESVLPILTAAFKLQTSLTPPEFLARIQSAKASIEANPQIRNLLKGPGFPLLLPQIPADADYGQFIEDVLLPAVEASYTGAYPKRKFINYRKGELQKQVTIVDERHAQLFKNLKQGPIPGILFPACLQGFSVLAQREMAELMPERISLAGVIENAALETAYPQSVSRDEKTPARDCSAVQWRDPVCSVYFFADGDGLGFGSGADLGRANDCCSGGLLVRG